MNTDVVTLQPTQIDTASAVLAQAFNKNPIFHYFALEAEPARIDLIKWVAKAILRYSQPYNQIYTTKDNFKGVAVWLPPGKYPTNNLRFLLSLMHAFPPKLRFKRLGQLISLFSTIEEHHQQDIPQPHWYLFMLGIAPNYQRQGIGSLLLQPILKQANQENLPCYLETSTEGGVRFYQRLGFEVVRSGNFPAANLQYWTLIRNPH